MDLRSFISIFERERGNVAQRSDAHVSSHPRPRMRTDQRSVSTPRPGVSPIIRRSSVRRERRDRERPIRRSRPRGADESAERRRRDRLPPSRRERPVTDTRRARFRERCVALPGPVAVGRLPGYPAPSRSGTATRRPRAQLPSVTTLQASPSTDRTSDRCWTVSRTTAPPSRGRGRPGCRAPSARRSRTVRRGTPPRPRNARRWTRPPVRSCR